MLRANTVDTMTLTCKTEYISTYNTFMVSFHRAASPSSLVFAEKNVCIHYGTDTLIFTDIESFLVSDKMSLSVFKLLHPPRSQSLVDGFRLTRAEVVRAAGGWRLGGGKGCRSRDPGVNCAVGGVL